MAIAPDIYADNDADIEVEDLPPGLSVEWFVAALGPGGAPPGPTATAIGTVSGTLTETGPAPVYRGVLEGAVITSQLLPLYANQQVALVVRSGQDVRVYGLTTVRASRLAP